MKPTNKLNFEKLDGLIPAIVQDSSTMQVLMLGFMNKEAYEQTIETKKVTFWSRTKKRLWQKGETSGDYLEILDIKTDIKIDCDNDTLLILAKPQGPTCHKGSASCFGEKIPRENTFFLKELANLIKDRKEKRPENSYTTTLFEKGLNEIVNKVGEESTEVIVAALNETKQRLIEESGDLLYHLIVLLAEKDIELDKVIEELRGRS
ncbi:bifunctional phosphoribosyl-AMP cyclohydrolase/phosphoribosyl-ATP diphosphatase HisIE [Candidatus Peregrinibacteria bacterium]|jgi:phosphoribosyl-AMP cyclohydrolase / phosphoribosyl-ATP pyrophosphohydrolase|nr:bifunctional phosphoribosyl-AMP cyclohydrolase/phosphoribosyl-ATP diphosphatase HisIE [Candidatus Peregrinibacteria bacterium]MBT4055755.1 bifunctional phosphoribosyl-AMP cyclohydrolase/phosphoribosyl-ATP diphosphatase HisIE [Candidatus Peregrinibacteria bacterium]